MPKQLSFRLSTSGLSPIAGSVVSGQPPQQWGSIVGSDGTLLYTNADQVWGPATQKLLGTYLAASGDPLSYTASVIPDTANGYTYFLDGFAQYAQYESLGIDVYFNRDVFARWNIGGTNGTQVSRSPKL